MATPQMGDMSFKNEVPLSAMMEMVANKRAREVELENAQMQQRQNQMNMFTETVASTSKMVEGMVKASTARQQQNARQVLASIFMEPGKEEIIGQKKIGERGGTPTAKVPIPSHMQDLNLGDQMKVANVPEDAEGIEAPAPVYQDMKYGDTPMGRTQDKRKLAALMTGFPEQAGKQMAEQAFPEASNKPASPNYIKQYVTIGDKVFGMTGRVDPKTNRPEVIPVDMPAGTVDPLVKPPLPNDAIKDVANLKSARRQFQTLRDTFNSEYSGPIEGRLRDFERTIGIDLGQLKNADQQQFQATMANAINQYIKATTGAQMSEPEAARIQRALPSVYRADESFVAQLDAALAEADAVLADRLSVYGDAGYRRVENVKAGLATKKPPAAPQNQKDPLGLFQ